MDDLLSVHAADTADTIHSRICRLVVAQAKDCPIWTAYADVFLSEAVQAAVTAGLEGAAPAKLLSSLVLAEAAPAGTAGSAAAGFRHSASAPFAFASAPFTFGGAELPPLAAPAPAPVKGRVKQTARKSCLSAQQLQAGATAQATAGGAPAPAVPAVELSAAVPGGTCRGWCCSECGGNHLVPEIGLKISCPDGSFSLRVSSHAAVREVKKAIGKVSNTKGLACTGC
jgi:hypothetical protein